MKHFDDYGWIIVAISLLFIVAQMVRFIFSYFIGG